MTNEEVEAQARAYKLELRKEYERGMLDAIEVFKGIASDQRKTLSAMDLPRKRCSKAWRERARWTQSRSSFGTTCSASVTFLSGSPTRKSYLSLWKKLNDARMNSENPWVWRIEFKPPTEMRP